MPSVAERLAALPIEERGRALALLSDEEQGALLHDWRGFLARPEQMLPAGDWYIWLLLAGRGFGKTRTGAEGVREVVEAGKASRIALVAETAADARDVMVSELLRIFPTDQRPEYIPSRRVIEFHNGAQAFTYNATEPDQLRGPQHDFGWCDEIAKWRYARETWDQLQFGMRLGADPRVIVTTTPRPIELVKAIVMGQEGKVHVTRGRTMDNRANLAAPFLDRIQARYAGTRLGRQELDAEILGDLPGALWTQGLIDLYRLSTRPKLSRIVVAVDPAITAEEDSDLHGIVVAGLTEDKREGVILEDCSMQGRPHEWAQRVALKYAEYEADCVVAEANQGGDMVAHTLKTVAPNMKVRMVHATRGKHVRAEPVAALYEQGRVRHIGQFPELEGQMTQMTNQGYQGSGSPDRLDAAVWALTDLFPDLTSKRADVSKLFAGGTGGNWMGR